MVKMAKNVTSEPMVRFSFFLRHQEDLTETLKQVWDGMMVWWKWPKTLTSQPSVRFSSSSFPRVLQDLSETLRQVWYRMVWFYTHLTWSFFTQWIEYWPSLDRKIWAGCFNARMKENCLKRVRMGVVTFLAREMLVRDWLDLWMAGPASTQPLHLQE